MSTLQTIDENHTLWLWNHHIVRYLGEMIERIISDTLRCTIISDTSCALDDVWNASKSAFRCLNYSTTLRSNQPCVCFARADFKDKDFLLNLNTHELLRTSEIIEASAFYTDLKWFRFWLSSPGNTLTTQGWRLDPSGSCIRRQHRLDVTPKCSDVKAF